LKTRIRRAALAAFFTFLVPLSTFAQTQTPSDGIRLPDPSRITRDDATAIESNPAGLGFMRSVEFGYGFYLPTQDLEGVVPDGHALFLAVGGEALGAGLGVQWIRRPGLGGRQQDYRKYTLSLGKAFGHFSVGSSLNWFGSSTSEALDDLATLDAGIQWRAARWLGLSFFARDINNGFLSETRSLPLRYGMSGALRFFGGRLTLESAFDTDSRSRFVRIQPRLLIEPYHGVRLFSNADFLFNRTDDTASFDFNQIGVGLSLSQTHFGFDVGSKFSNLGFDGDLAYEGWGGYFWVSPYKQRSISSQDKWVLVDLNRTYAEQKTTQLLSSSSRSFLDLVNKLIAIEKDESVKGILVTVGQGNFSWAQAWEIRKLINNIRSSGKNSISYLSNPNLRQYYIASASKSIWITPDSTFALGGIRTSTLNAAKAIASTGIEAQFVRIGDYKSAPELFVKSQPSEASKEQKKGYIDAFYNEALKGIASSRKVSIEKVKSLIHSDGLFPDEALAQGWAEKIVYADEGDAIFRKEISSHIVVSYPPVKTREERWDREPVIAVLAIDGDIVSGSSQNIPFLGQKTVGHKSVLETLAHLGGNSRVKGVVIRINSPGGSALASDQIYRAIRKLAQRKPVVTSMGGVAASGGYYLAAGADEIFAAPNTVTGSIGIFTGNFNGAKLMKSLGINRSVYQKGNPIRYTLYQGWNEKEIASIKKNLIYLYHLFLTQVAATRPLDQKEVDKVARGHVWSGMAAKEVKLVDTIGGLSDAIQRVRDLSGLEEGEGITLQYGTLDLGVQSSILGVNLFGAEKTEAELARALLLPFKDLLRILLTYKSGEALMLLEEKVD